MFKLFICVSCIFAITSAFPTIAEDENGDEYLMVPLLRERRQTTYDITKARDSTSVKVAHQGTIHDDGINKVTGGANIAKTFPGPFSYGGNVSYEHRSGSGIGVDVQKTNGRGTDVGVQGHYNIWRKGNARVDAIGSYGRHYGGPSGTGTPNYYGGVSVKIPF